MTLSKTCIHICAKIDMNIENLTLIKHQNLMILTSKSLYETPNSKPQYSDFHNNERKINIQTPSLLLPNTPPPLPQKNKK